MHIIALYGSLSERSINKSLARTLAELVPDGVVIELLGPQNVPLFNEDIEYTAYPPEIQKAKEAIAAADGVIIITPEYNRTIPAALKNFLDWSSRPENAPSVWAGKPVAVTGASSGPRGASFAQYDVKRVMQYFNAWVMGQPEFYFGPSGEKMDPEGRITDARSRESLKKFLETFIRFVEREQTASVR